MEEKDNVFSPESTSDSPNIQVEKSQNVETSENAIETPTEISGEVKDSALEKSEDVNVGLSGLEEKNVESNVASNSTSPTLQTPQSLNNVSVGVMSKGVASATNVQYNSTPPEFILKDLKVDRLCRICNNLVITALLLMALMGLAFIIVPVFQMAIILVLLFIMIFIVIFTLGLVFLDTNSPLAPLWDAFQKVSSTTEMIGNVMNFLLSLTPIVSIVCICASIISIVSTGFIKTKRKAGRITLHIFAIIIFVVAIILYYAIGGKVWQG